MSESPSAASRNALSDPARLAALRRSGLLDTPCEQAFDRLTRLATRIVSAPIALITLVDDSRQFFKSSAGAPDAMPRESPLEGGFCALVAKTGSPLIVNDARNDPEFKNYPVVTEVGVGAYAGIPLTTSGGHHLGALSVLDTVPHVWSAEQIDVLTDLAKSVVTEIELRIGNHENLALRDVAEIKITERTALAERRSRQLRTLASRLIQSEARERRRVAGILHDKLQQQLLGVKFRLDAIRARTPDLVEHLGPCVESVDLAVQTSRSLTMQLSPPLLHEVGLKPALDWLARRTAEKTGMETTIVLHGEEPHLDEDLRVLLFQAVQELLTNVTKHSGALRARVVIDNRQSGFLQISVEDTGRGFDSGILQSQLDETTGFGLFSLRERLECLDGSLTIASQAGGGTRVVLIAPVESAFDAPVDATAPPIPASSSRKPPADTAAAPAIRVMLVDDHTIVREGLRGIMEDEKDMRVVAEAEDGAKAIDLARRLQPDVIVMDVNMPTMGGIEATRRIVAEFPNIRVIGLSFHGRDDMASAMRRAGACDYVSKDAATETLCDSIRAQMRG